MTRHRTEDTTYGQEYWDTLDGGRGYQQSCMWRDIGHIITETWLIDFEAGKDLSGDCRHVDVGCAMGFLVQAMRERGVESWGLDFSRYALDHAPDEVFSYLRQYDLRSVDDSFFGKERFTLVTCIETLEHIDEPFVERALTHLFELLKPGGYFLATICVEGQHGWDTDPTHVTIKSHAWWEQRLFEVGFEIDPRREAMIQRWWLFSQHLGVFCARRPLPHAETCDMGKDCSCPAGAELSSDAETVV